MLSPRRPNPRSINEASQRMPLTPATASSRARQPSALKNGSGISAPSTSSVPMVAGPTMIGIASGTAAMSASGSGRAGGRPAWTRATADRNSSAPAPIRKASRVMPSTEKITRPNRNSARQNTLTAAPTLRARAWRWGSV